MSNIDMGALNVEFHCPKCGGSMVSVPDDETEGPWITCGSCGEQLITVSECNSEIERVGAEVMKSKLSGERVTARFRNPALKLGKIE